MCVCVGGGMAPLATLDPLLGGGGGNWPGPVPQFVAQIFLADVTHLRDVVKISLTPPPLQKSWIRTCKHSNYGKTVATMK